MNINQRTKRVIGRISASQPFRALLKSAYCRQNNIVFHHLIGECPPHYSIFGEPYSYEQFLCVLKKIQEFFNIVPLNTILQRNEKNCLIKEPELAITFDDGLSLYQNELLEILDERKVKVTTFVVTSSLDNENLLWRHKLSTILDRKDESFVISKFNDLFSRESCTLITSRGELLRRSFLFPMNEKDEMVASLWEACDMPPIEEYLEEKQPYFTWKQLEGWIERGHSVGLHTHTHPLCSRLGKRELQNEIIVPSQILKERLKLSSIMFAYPFGDRLSRSVEDSLYKRGVFDCALGIEGFSDYGTEPFRLERTCLAEGVDFAIYGRTALKVLRSRRNMFKLLRG